MRNYHSRCPEDPARRFWRKVDKSTDCWLWTYYRSPIGYGIFKISRFETMQAHRYSWYLAHRLIPEGMMVLHRCDVRACVRPDHLFLGTQLDNMRDCLAKGRLVPPIIRKGVLHHAAKLSEEQVLEIRRLCAQGHLSKTAIGRMFGIGQPTVSTIAARKSWRHLPES